MEWMQNNPMQAAFVLLCVVMSIVMLAALVWTWITTAFGRQGGASGGGNGQAGANAAPAQQAAGGNAPLIGFFFFAASALSLPLGYFLPYPWNGMGFIVCATASFFVKIRYRTPRVTNWDGVRKWLTHRRSLYTIDADNRRRLTGYSYRRLSGFFVAEAFALAMFEAFFRFVVPQYPGAILAFFLAILYFIAAGLAEGIIDGIARRFSWVLVIGIVGATVVVTLHILFFEHIEQRMGSIGIIALAMGLLGWYLRTRDAHESRNAGLGFLAVSFLALIAVTANFVSILDKPAQKYIKAARAYQDGANVEFDGRVFPPTKQEPKPMTPAQPAPLVAPTTMDMQLRQPLAILSAPAVAAPANEEVGNDSVAVGNSEPFMESREQPQKQEAEIKPPPVVDASKEAPQTADADMPERIYAPRLDYVFVLAEDPPARQESPPVKRRGWSRADEIFR